MRLSREAARLSGTLVALGIVLAFVPSGCGVFPSSDCAAKATCVGEGGDESGDSGEEDGSNVEAPYDEGGDDTIAIADVPSDVQGAGDEEGETSDGPSDEVDAGTDVAEAGCVPSPEDCTNGKDDNCDGLIDCADPVCGAYTCTTPVPAGWMGPVALWQANTPASPPGCDPGWGNPVDLHAGLSAAPATCGCACAATGQVCSATGTFYSSTSCTGVNGTAVATGNACTPVTGASTGSQESFVATSATPSGGKCTATTSKTVSAIAWSKLARTCTYTGRLNSPGGCAAGQCVAAPSSNFTSLCVYSTVNPPPTSCPAGYTKTAPMVFYAGQPTDTRDCGPCSCGTPSGGSCAGTIALYGDLSSSCTGATVSYPVGAPCSCYGQAGCPLGVNPLPNKPAFVQANYKVTPGTCATPIQPQPVGTATPTGPTTLCCRP